MRWDENAVAVTMQLAHPLDPVNKSQQPGGAVTVGKGTISAGHSARAEVISMTSDMSNNTSLI